MHAQVCALYGGVLLSGISLNKRRAKPPWFCGLPIFEWLTEMTNSHWQKWLSVQSQLNSTHETNHILSKITQQQNAVINLVHDLENPPVPSQISGAAHSKADLY